MPLKGYFTPPKISCHSKPVCVRGTDLIWSHWKCQVCNSICFQILCIFKHAAGKCIASYIKDPKLLVFMHLVTKQETVLKCKLWLHIRNSFAWLIVYFPLVLVKSWPRFNNIQFYQNETENKLVQHDHDLSKIREWVRTTFLWFTIFSRI